MIVFVFVFNYIPVIYIHQYLQYQVLDLLSIIAYFIIANKWNYNPGIELSQVDNLCFAGLGLWRFCQLWKICWPEVVGEQRHC